METYIKPKPPDGSDIFVDQVVDVEDNTNSANNENRKSEGTNNECMSQDSEEEVMGEGEADIWLCSFLWLLLLLPFCHTSP